MNVFFFSGRGLGAYVENTSFLTFEIKFPIQYLYWLKYNLGPQLFIVFQQQSTTGFCRLKYGFILKSLK